MKKFSSKFIASSVLAVLVASAMAVSAAAVGADYRESPADRPAYTPPATQTVTGDTSGNTDKTDDKTEDEKTDESTGANVVDEEAVKDAIANGTVIDVVVADGKALVQEAAIGEIAKGDKPVTFKVADDASGFDCYITIDPKSITKVQAINLAMNIQVVEEGTLGEGVMITPAQKGDFGMTLYVTIEAGAFANIDLAKANLYYISDALEITLIPNGFTVNADKSVTVGIPHASAYVITDVDLIALASGLDVDINIDDDDDDDDDDVIISDDDDTEGKDDTVVVNPGSAEGTDANPVTGTTLALGSLAVFAAAAVATSKKRK
jgi:hypothetical protein